MKVTIRHSKTDQEGAGQTIAIPLGKIACPVAALKEWISAAGIGSGALFRSVNRHGKVGERLTDQIGLNQIGRLEIPLHYPVVKWAPDEIVATESGDLAGCRKVTISVVRKSETAVWVEEPINQARAACIDADTKLYKAALVAMIPISSLFLSIGTPTTVRMPATSTLSTTGRWRLNSAATVIPSSRRLVRHKSLPSPARTTPDTNPHSISAA